jgi:hypothetical protein
MKKKKAIDPYLIFHIDEFDTIVNVLGTKILCEQIELAGMVKTTKFDENVFTVPKKYNRYINDVVVARILILNSKLKAKSMYFTKATLRKAYDEISFHVCDQIITHEFNRRTKKLKEPLSIGEFFDIKSLLKHKP